MVNFYTILGVAQNASLSEIKSAFRKLAKLYHPDKNPAGKEEFTKFLRAYETLSDPVKRRAYDLKLKYHREDIIGGTKKKGGQKNWSFDEKEMKRRKYYDEHIRKYEKHTGKDPRVTEVRKNYNEYKYILFATPLAVALFLMIVNLAGGTHNGGLARPAKVVEAGMAEEGLKMGDSPYTEYFGEQLYQVNGGMSLVVKNQTGKDLILCIFSGDRFLRSCFVADGFFAEIPQLPVKKMNLRYTSGKDWDARKLMNETNTYGGFTKEVDYYSGINEIDPVHSNELTLVGGLNEGFSKTGPKDFFKKN